MEQLKQNPLPRGAKTSIGEEKGDPYSKKKKKKKRLKSQKAGVPLNKMNLLRLA